MGNDAGKLRRPRWSVRNPKSKIRNALRFSILGADFPNPSAPSEGIPVRRRTGWRLFLAAALLFGTAWGCANPSEPADPKPEAEVVPAPEPPDPLRVGFDVDDTLLFSSPAFGVAFGTKGIKPYSKPFWEIVNGSDDGLSRVKKKTLEILKKHRAEGAEIFVITARRSHGGEGLKAFIDKTFAVPPDRVFFETRGKAKRIRALGLDLFYGDSDSDISAARDAGAEGVRILRSPKSSYKKKYTPGKYGERIVEGSEE
jgi:acid phosphatase (class B)